MSSLPYHAWTHRPKEEGGTDPIPQSGCIPWVSSLHDSPQTIPADTSTELALDAAFVSDRPQTAISFDVDAFPTLHTPGLYAWHYDVNFDGTGSSAWAVLQTLFFGDCEYLAIGTTESYDIAALSATGGAFSKAQHGWLILGPLFPDPVLTIKPYITCDTAEDIAAVFTIFRIDCVYPPPIAG